MVVVVKKVKLIVAFLAFSCAILNIQCAERLAWNDYIVSEFSQEDIEQGLNELFQRGVSFFEGATTGVRNYAHAQECFQEIIDSGRADAELLVQSYYYLGSMNFIGGYGLARDTEKAKEYFRSMRAYSSYNDPYFTCATYYLGVLYFLEKKYQAAWHYFENVTRSNTILLLYHMWSHYYLGCIYLVGDGAIERSEKDARECFEAIVNNSDLDDSDEVKVVKRYLLDVLDEQDAAIAEAMQALNSAMTN